MSDNESRTLPSNHPISLHDPSRIKNVRTTILQIVVRAHHSYRSPTLLQSGRHLPNSLLRCAQSRFAVGLDPEKSFRPSAAFCCRFTHLRAYVAFGLETLQGRINSSNRNVAACAHFDFSTYGHAIGVLAQSHDGKEDNMLQ